MIPTQLQALPVLGFVRNPWSYYVSWYNFQTQMARPNGLYRCMSANGALDFKRTIINLLNLGSDVDKLDELLPLLPDEYVGHGLNLPRFALEPIRSSGFGFYSYLYHYMFAAGGGQDGENGRLTIGRCESLREDFLQFIQAVDPSPPPGLCGHIVNGAELNVSRHQPYSHYYDDELRELVNCRDGELIRGFGYQFAA